MPSNLIFDRDVMALLNPIATAESAIVATINRPGSTVLSTTKAAATIAIAIAKFLAALASDSFSQPSKASPKLSNIAANFSNSLLR